MQRNIMSVILGVMVIGLLAGTLPASQYDPENPGRWYTPFQPVPVANEAGWFDPTRKAVAQGDDVKPDSEHSIGYALDHPGLQREPSFKQAIRWAFNIWWFGICK